MKFQIPECKGSPVEIGKHTFYIAAWSSLVARWAHNPKVVGSNPTVRNLEEFIIVVPRSEQNYG